MNKIEKYQWGRVLKWLGTSIDDIPKMIKYTPTRSRGAYTLFERPITPFKSGSDFVIINGKQVPMWQLPKGQRHQLVKPKYENLVFIRNLDGLPSMEDGLVLASPKHQYFSNFTTDLPFRLHHDYAYAPGAEYMIVHPRAFKGIKPFTIDPMDVIFKNSELRFNPKDVTIISGNTSLLREAKAKGMNIGTNLDLVRKYRSIEQQMIPGKHFGVLDADGIYRNAVDNYFTRMGRPKYQAYYDLEKATGLPSHTIPFNKMLTNFKIGKSGVTWGNMSKPAFIYPDGAEIIGTKILTTELPDFYKHVGYNPTPRTEGDLLNSMGGFSKPHPTIDDVGSYADDIFMKWRSENVPGSLKRGGKIHE